MAWNATCDFGTDGGGWTVIWEQENKADLSSRALAYDVDDPNLRALAREVLIGFFDSTGNVTGHHARWTITSNWVNQIPFAYPSAEETTEVFVDGVRVGPQTIRYGWERYMAGCSGAWTATGNASGRVCVTGTSAPFFGGFSGADAETCDSSGSTSASPTCATAGLRFFIAVR